MIHCRLYLKEKKIIFLSVTLGFVLANSADPYEMPHYVHLGFLHQGISEPVFYCDLVHKLKRIVGKPIFSDQFKEII